MFRGWTKYVELLQNNYQPTDWCETNITRVTKAGFITVSLCYAALYRRSCVCVHVLYSNHDPGCASLHSHLQSSNVMTLCIYKL